MSTAKKAGLTKFKQSTLDKLNSQLNPQTSKNMNETITIPKSEYESLLEDSEWLRCLENAGVDNWEGIDFARELLNEQE